MGLDREMTTGISVAAAGESPADGQPVAARVAVATEGGMPVLLLLPLLLMLLLLLLVLLL